MCSYGVNRWGLSPEALYLVLSCSTQTNVLAVKDGKVKAVFFQEKDNVPAFSQVIEFEEE